VTLTAYDACGNVVAGYAGTVAFASSDPGAGLRGNYTFTAADRGGHDFTVTLQTPGTMRLIALDVGSLILADLDIQVST
jgi:hypothetical protein